MKKLILIIAFLNLVISTNAQWQFSYYSNGNTKCFATSGNNIFAGNAVDGILLSSDNGNSWTVVNNGLTNTVVNALAVSGSNIFAGTNGGVFLSNNNGNSWIAVSAGLTNDTVLSLAISGSKIFAGTAWNGVFLSTNNANSWTEVNTAISDTAKVNVLVIKDSVVFAGTADGGVLMSSDNGGSWTASGLTNNTIYSIAVSGNDLYASTWYNGVFLSTNNGISWNVVNNGLTTPNIMALATIDNNIFAGTYDAGVFLSSNNGNNWTAEGLTNTYNIYSLAICGSNIYAGTSGIFKRSLSDMICSAQFTLVPDTTTLHHYYVINNAIGVSPLSYLWSWGDGSQDTIAFPSHTYNTAGNYNICLTITDSGGCSSTFCDSSYLQKSQYSIISVEVIQGITGINSLELTDQLKIYPNPAKNNLTIESLQKAVVEILNIQGQKILHQELQPRKIDIDISGLEKGVYILRLLSNDKTVVTKFIKE